MVPGVDSGTDFEGARHPALAHVHAVSGSLCLRVHAERLECFARINLPSSRINLGVDALPQLEGPLTGRESGSAKASGEGSPPNGRLCRRVLKFVRTSENDNRNSILTSTCNHGFREPK